MDEVYAAAGFCINETITMINYNDVEHRTEENHNITFAIEMRPLTFTLQQAGMRYYQL